MKDRPNLEVGETHLSRELSQFDITMIGVGAMIGAGIFVLTGIAAGAAGPALMLAFALNGVVTLFTAMVYAELGSAIPEAGGGYLWVKESMGGSQGFLAGWMSWFSHAVAGALYALGFGSYFHHLLAEYGWTIAALPRGIAERGLGVAIILVFVYINYRGTSETGLAGNIVTLGKLAVIVLFIGSGLWTIWHRPAAERLADFTPFMPEGWGAVFIAMGFTFIAFEGYEIIVQAGEEVVDPRRSIPKAVFWSLVIVVPIYVLVGFTALGAIESDLPTWQFLGEHKELGLVEAARQFMPLGTLLLLFGGLLSTVSALNATTFSSTRVAYAMGRDDALPSAFGSVHGRTKTPWIALLATAVIMIFMVVAIPIEAVATAADVMFLLLFLQVNWAVMRVRREFGERLEYGYLMPFYPWVPLAGIALKAFLAVYLYWFSPQAWFLAAAWIGAGVLVYATYSRQRLAEAEEPRVATERHPRPAWAEHEERILVYVEDPEEARTELRIAAALEAVRDTGVLAVNVVQLPRQTPLRAWEGRSPESERILDELDDIAESTGIKLHSMIAVGHAVSRTLDDIARRLRAPLIVLGWRGGVYERRIRGSIADAVLRASPGDVLLVRDRGLPETVGRVTLALSPGLVNELTLDTAVDLARGLDAGLRLVCLIRGGAEAAGDARESPGAIGSGDDSQGAVATGRADGDGATDLDGWLELVRQRCVDEGLADDALEWVKRSVDDVVDALVEEADDADVMVMGASRDWVDPDHLLGVVPDTVANRSSTTIVVAKGSEARVLSWVRRVAAMLSPR